MAFDPTSAKVFDASSAKAAASAPASVAAPEDDSTDSGALFAALHGAADTATFGLADRAAAGVGAVASHLEPGAKPMSYSEAYARIKANNAKTAGNNPVSALLGDIGGIGVGGGAISAAAKGLKAVVPGADALASIMAIKKGAPIANTLKAAGTGAAFGAADAAGHGGNADDIALSAAGGAVAAPIVSKVATTAIKALAPAAQKAMALLADKIGETPDTLQRAYANFQASTGRVPTMAEIVGLKSSGELRQVAGSNPIVGAAATDAADAAAAARPTTLPAHIEAITGQPAQDISTLTQARKARMDTAMDPIRDTPVMLDTNDLSTLSDARVREATRGDPDLRRRIGEAQTDIGAHGNSDALTVNDIDSIRKGLRGRQAAYSNPANNLHNPHTAAGFGDVANRITDLGTGAEPGYKDALAQFEADSHYIKGFNHGNAGKDIGEASDPSLINSLGEPEGQQGYASGVQSRLQTAARSSESGALRTAADMGQDAGTQDQLRSALGPRAARRLQAAGQSESTAADRLNTISPGAPNPTAQPSGQQAAQAGAAALSHSPAGIAFHLTRAIPGLNKSMSAAVQKKVAQYLLDPNMTQQGINLLRKAGAKNADIRRLALSISANVGANTGEAFAGQ